MSVKPGDIIAAAREVTGAFYAQWDSIWPPAAGAPFYITGSTDTAYVYREGINCAGLLNLALRKCGLPPAGGTGSIGDYLIELEDFDVNSPAVPGAIALRPWGGGVANLEEGHVAIFVNEHSLIQADHRGVNEYDTDYDSQSWAGFTVYGKLPGVDYSQTSSDPSEAPTTPSEPVVLTPELLVQAMTSRDWSGPDLDPEDAERYFPHLRKACKHWGIDTRARLSAFLAQVGAESGSFKWWREFSRGEGKPFGAWYGRGPMQLTWEENYQNFQDATGYRAHDNRELVADDAETGFESAGWYWRQGNGDLNTLADVATWPAFYEITGRVWGQSGPFAERDARYDHAWNVLPETLQLPDENNAPPEEDKDDGEAETWRTDGWWAPVRKGSRDLRHHPPQGS